MTLERIARLDLDQAKEAAAAVGVPDYMADLSVFQVLLHNPPVAKALNDLLGALLWNGVLDARLRELIIMRLGWVTGSVYEWTQHWRVAVGLGVAEADLVGVREWADHPAFGEVERAVLAATDEIVERGVVSDATWAVCRRLFDDSQLVELVAVIGNWRLFASVLRTLEVPLEDGVEPWPPDGRAP